MSFIMRMYWPRDQRTPLLNTFSPGLLVYPIRRNVIVNRICMTAREGISRWMLSDLVLWLVEEHANSCAGWARTGEEYRGRGAEVF